MTGRGSERSRSLDLNALHVRPAARWAVMVNVMAVRQFANH
jgi:hypothetical protein